MYNTYIVPVCEISKSKVYNIKIVATSKKDCEDKIINRFSDYSDKIIYKEFIQDLDNPDILIGKIYDIEEL